MTGSSTALLTLMLALASSSLVAPVQEHHPWPPADKQVFVIGLQGNAGERQDQIGRDDLRPLPRRLHQPKRPLVRLPEPRAPPPGLHSPPLRQQLPRPHRRLGQPAGPSPRPGTHAAGCPRALLPRAPTKSRR
ncbi:hypothetical protein ACP70R_015709 [Stipagrostis hirtigluma subsp. patula]